MAGKAWAPWPERGEGERCGEDAGGGEGVWARGDSGMLPADLRRGERYWRWSLGARPWSELGRVCPEPAGELGTLELGELLCEELPPTWKRQTGARGVSRAMRGTVAGTTPAVPQAMGNVCGGTVGDPQSRSCGKPFVPACTASRVPR